jgi:hypothetical protein
MPGRQVKKLLASGCAMRPMSRFRRQSKRKPGCTSPSTSSSSGYADVCIDSLASRQLMYSLLPHLAIGRPGALCAGFYDSGGLLLLCKNLRCGGLMQVRWLTGNQSYSLFLGRVFEHDANTTTSRAFSLHNVNSAQRVMSVSSEQRQHMCHARCNDNFFFVLFIIFSALFCISTCTNLRHVQFVSLSRRLVASCIRFHREPSRLGQYKRTRQGSGVSNAKLRLTFRTRYMERQSAVRTPRAGQQSRHILQQQLVGMLHFDCK